MALERDEIRNSCVANLMPNIRGNYITNLSLSDASGGWSGFNVAIFNSLSRHFALTYVGPVSPREDLPAKLLSRLVRAAGGRGSFPFFSRRRLNKSAQLVAQLADGAAEADFFHGSTPWLDYVPQVPYACYLDVCFSTYVSVYHNRSQFDTRDLDRIARKEASWLRAAARVFFSSAWGMETAIAAYGLDPSTLRVAGLGGHLPIPSADTFAGGNDFLFIALDFLGKGGKVCVDAFEQIREEHPQARLRIVGQRPPANVLERDGIMYEGFLRKSVPSELARLQNIFSTAFALVHPTLRDATPQVIIEAQYHGCPAIAPRAFGIPEMIVDGITGCLVDAPATADNVAARMRMLCTKGGDYANMRRASRARALETFTWERVGDRIACEMRSVVS
jgi:glycosyltransferase involved in cell wall biosynthesis